MFTILYHIIILLASISVKWQCLCYQPVTKAKYSKTAKKYLKEKLEASAPLAFFFQLFINKTYEQQLLQQNNFTCNCNKPITITLLHLHD